MALANSLTCVNPNISLSELANSILFKESDASDAVTGLLVTMVDVDTNDIVPVAACLKGGVPLSFEQILRMAFGIDSDGHTTLVLFVKTP